jgi:hypothetical protein
MLCVTAPTGPSEKDYWSPSRHVSVIWKLSVPVAQEGGQKVAHEPGYGPTAAGTVLLELGGEVGALILTVPAGLAGAEIEISRDGQPRCHARVRERQAGGDPGYAAVYPGLAAGRYTIWRDRETPAGSVEVAGGQVATFDWP